MGFGEEEYGFDVGESVVDAGDVSFVLKVFDRSDAAEHKAAPTRSAKSAVRSS